MELAHIGGFQAVALFLELGQPLRTNRSHKLATRARNTLRADPPTALPHQLHVIHTGMTTPRTHRRSIHTSTLSGLQMRTQDRQDSAETRTDLVREIRQIPENAHPSTPSPRAFGRG